MCHVIWDWNGTLVDDLPVVVSAVNESLSRIGAEPIGVEEYRDHYTRPVRLFYERLLARPITDAQWRLIDDTFHSAYAASLDRVPLTHDAWEAVETLRQAGCSQSILSMWWHDDLVPEVTRHGLDQIMVRIEGNVLGAGDTKATLLGLHLDRLPMKGRSVMIGDALDDAQAAAAAGIPCVLYDGGSHHRTEMDSLSVPVATTLVEAARTALSL